MCRARVIAVVSRRAWVWNYLLPTAAPEGHGVKPALTYPALVALRCGARLERGDQGGFHVLLLSYSGCGAGHVIWPLTSGPMKP